VGLMLHGWVTALSGRSDLDIQWQWWFAISVADTGGKMNPKPKGGVNVLRMLYCVCICDLRHWIQLSEISCGTLSLRYFMDFAYVCLWLVV